MGGGGYLQAHRATTPAIVVSIAGVVDGLDVASAVTRGQNGLADFLCSILDVLHALSDPGTSGLVATSTLGDVVFTRGDQRLELFV